MPASRRGGCVVVLRIAPKRLQEENVDCYVCQEKRGIVRGDPQDIRKIRLDNRENQW